jgi:hypothetical protein
LRVEDGRAAALFIDPAQLRFLKPFLGGPSAIAPAARLLGVSISRMSYQVAKLQRLGLVRAAASAAAPGGSRRQYEATARQFVVPLQAVPVDDVETLYARFKAAWLDEQLASVVGEALRRAQAWEIRFPETEGSDRIAFAPADGTDAAALGIVDQAWTLALTPADARRLQRELLDLVARYAALPARPGAQAQVIGITAVRRHARRDAPARPALKSTR